MPNREKCVLGCREGQSEISEEECAGMDRMSQRLTAQQHRYGPPFQTRSSDVQTDRLDQRIHTVCEPMRSSEVVLESVYSSDDGRITRRDDCNDFRDQ